jgi:hypothetical protein
MRKAILTLLSRLELARFWIRSPFYRQLEVYFRCGREYRGRRIRVMGRRVPMTARSAYRERWLARALLRAVILLTPFVAGPAHAADTLKVEVDRAVLARLPAHVATIVIGNPLIADVTVQHGGLMVITGKGFGTTNLIALDRSGAVLTEHNIEVVGPRAANVVVVYRGLNRESYSCAPECERRITLGDSPEFFEGTIGQATSRAARAQAAAPAQH